MAIEILACSEQGPTAGCECAYLCVQVLETGRIELSERRYEALGACSEFRDEATAGGLHPDWVPRLINGRSVVGIEEDWIAGGELLCREPTDRLEFGPGDVHKAEAWLAGRGWKRRKGFAKAWRALRDKLGH
jgi:hypothetical protein